MKHPVEWQIATVKDIRQETPQVKTFTLALPAWTQHRAGQHYDLRLTAADGYQSQRSYSIASEPERTGEIDLTIEKISEGEVSSYMHEVVQVGDQIEVRGPIGGYFVWEAKLGGPLLLVAGGSGIVPLMAMLRHRAAAGAIMPPTSGEGAEVVGGVPARLLFSSRTPDEAIYFAELEKLCARTDGLLVFHTFTRAQPPGWNGYSRRIDKEMLGEVAKPLGKSPQVFICGPTAIVETAANALVQLGISTGQIKTERFGPTGN
jgi:ferredoxin-NADP reductase